MAWPHPTGRAAIFRTEPPKQRSPSFSGHKRKRSAPAHDGPKAGGWKPDRVITWRSQGAVHDSRPRRGEPPSLRVQELPESSATLGLQRPPHRRACGRSWRWPASAANHPLIQLHVSRDVVQEVLVHLNFQGAEPGQQICSQGSLGIRLNVHPVAVDHPVIRGVCGHFSVC